MVCDVCGKSYGVTHECAGAAPPILSSREAAPVPSGFAPIYYLQLAYQIMRWDDVSVRRAAQDSRALYYGIAFSTGAAVLLVVRVLSPVLSASLNQEGLSGGLVRWISGAIFLVIAVGILGITSLLQLGVCHAIAKLFFGATGTFTRIVRPLSLGWSIQMVTLIPIAGQILATFLWAAVLMVVFEEVNHIRRLQAFLISYGVNLVFLGVGRILVS